MNKKYGVLCGYWMELVKGKSSPGVLDLFQYTHNVMLDSGYPVWNDCCTSVLPSDYGKVLTVSQNGIVLTTPTGGSSISNLSLASSPTTNVISNSNGTGFVINSATSTNAGLLSSALYTSITALITNGFNSTMSVTGNGLVATPFKLVNDVASPGNNFYYGTDATGVKGWYSLLGGGGGGGGNTITNEVSASFKYLELIPTGINTIPTLVDLPIDNTEVVVSVNGVIEKGITVSALGVFTVNTTLTGYNIDSNDKIQVQYFSI